MEEWVGNIKEITEILYYLAGIGLLVGIFIGLNQLKLVKEELNLLKNDFLVRNQRASVEKSIEYLNWFATDFIPQGTVYNGKLKGKKTIKYSNLPLEDMDFIFNGVINSHNTEVMNSIDNKIEANVIDLLNQLEFFSAAMMSGLADEKLAFNPLSTPFCKFVENNYDVYCYCKHKTDNNDGLFGHTKELYIMWKERQNETVVKQQTERSSKRKGKNIRYIGSE